jgi:hypothetical protein
MLVKGCLTSFLPKPLLQKPNSNKEIVNDMIHGLEVEGSHIVLIWRWNIILSTNATMENVHITNSCDQIYECFYSIMPSFAYF